MLLGAESVLATDYYIKSNWKGDDTDWGWRKMVDNGDGTYYCVGHFHNNNGCGWNTTNTGNGTFIAQGELINGSGSDLTAGTYKFTLNTNVSPKTITLSTYESVTVNIYLESTHNTYLYAWNDMQGWENATWAGTQFSGATTTYQGHSWYKQSLTFPKGGALKLKFSNNGANQSSEIYEGLITASADFYYSVDNQSKVAYVSGNFDSDSWTSKMFLGDKVIWSMKGDGTTKYFKVIYNDAWYGLYDAGTITGTVSGWWLNDNKNGGGDANNVGLTLKDYPGYYIFTLDGTHNGEHGFGPTISVTYPTKYQRDGLAAGAWGTICLPGISNATYYPNATFYSIDHKVLNGSGDPISLVLVEETGELVAGRPYIFKMKSADDFILSYNGSEDADNYRGLVGAIDAIDVSNMTALIGTTNVYLLTNVDGVGYVRKAAEGSSLGANKAYINMNNVPTTPLAGAPGARFEIPLAPNNATSIQDIEANDIAVKFIENGKFFIQKNGVVYDATGRVVR